MIFTQMNRLFQLVICLSIISFISGCVSTDISELENTVAEIMARPGGRIKSLPEIKHYEAYAYQSGDSESPRNPFKLFYIANKPEIIDESITDDGLTEEMGREIGDRNREELEQFELDSLRMVGSMDNESNKWAIVLDPNGVVHRVEVGNYIGTNIGKIINIDEDKVNLREIVQDSTGRWEERKAVLVLLEEE